MLEKARRTVPGITLRTSFIVGFPGESEQDFQELCEFVREAQFDWLGVFGYSDEDGCAAHGLDADLKVSPREIERRRKKLMKLQQGISKRGKAEFISFGHDPCKRCTFHADDAPTGSNGARIGSTRTWATLGTPVGDLARRSQGSASGAEPRIDLSVLVAA